MSADIEILRKNALAIFQAGIIAADPYIAVKQCLSVNKNHLEIALKQNFEKRVGNWSKIHLIAFGKAACAMAKAAQEIIPESTLACAIAVTNYENVQEIENLEILGASHPLPDENGYQAAKRITEQLKAAQQDELVLVLISGGGSALLPYPVGGISLEEKISTTDLLLACGVTINEINCVRKHLSQLKGGRLTQLAYPADVHALILSDVLGDDLSAIASGTTVADDSTYTDAITVFKSRQVWDRVPINVQKVLEEGVQGKREETPKSDNPSFKNSATTLVGSNAISVTAMINTAKEQGYQAKLYSDNLNGEARDEADKLALYVKQLIEAGIKKPIALLAGGETTVTLKGKGKGGRNQEMALAFALASEKYALPNCWTFLSGGTDGIDGTSPAAGGIVDAESVQRMKQAKLNPSNELNNNNSYIALEKSEDLIMTGATGTNVADLQIVLIQPCVIKP